MRSKHVLGLALLLPSVASADVDWSRGLITAEGVGIANRQAPSPAAAREPARRMAEDAAKKALAAQLPAIPHARGDTVKEHLNAATQERMAQVIERAITVAATPHTDGSWNVTLAVPVEAVRIALDGAVRSVTSNDAEPPIVIIEGVTATPAVGYAIGPWSPAVLWMKDVPAWAKTAPRVKATGTKPGAIQIPAGKPSGATTTGGPSTLFIVLTR